MVRKWNGIGSTQIKILQTCSRGPKTEDELIDKFNKTVLLNLERLVSRGLLVNKEGLYRVTDHGKMIQKAPEVYNKWKKSWGMS